MIFGPNFFADVAYFKLEKSLKDLDVLAEKIGVTKEDLKEPFEKISEKTPLMDLVPYFYS